MRTLKTPPPGSSQAGESQNTSEGKNASCSEIFTKVSEKIQNCLAAAFGMWGAFVTRCTLLVFVLSLCFFGWAAMSLQDVFFYK